MANKKLSQLTSSGSLGNTDIIPIVSGGATRRITASVLKSYITANASLLDFGLADGTSGQVLTTDGAGNLTFTTVSGGGGFSGNYNDLTNKPDLSQYQLSSTAFSGSYNDLTNTPTIPTNVSQLTNDSGFITAVSWTDVSSKPTFATVATSGSYSDLTNVPNIPTNLSQLVNDLSVDANTLTGTTLAVNVTNSSLTNVGILTGLTSSGIVHITNTDDSINANTGSLQVDGGAHITKNLIAEGTVYAGVNAYSEVLTNPLIVASSPSNAEGGYSQVAILNNTAEASGDYQVFMDGYDVNVSDTGWSDIGMSGSNFGDPRYTITNPGDGYVFVSGAEGTAAGGNLVLSTDGSGQVNDMVFATGGFLIANEKMRLKNSDGSLTINSGLVNSDSNLVLTATDKSWTFDTNGELTLPTGVSNTGRIINNSGISFKVGTDYWTLDTNGVLNLPATIGDIKRDGVSVLSSTYTLPAASDTVLGGVKIDGVTLALNGSGQLYYTGSGVGGYTLPPATASTLGGIKVGTNLSVTVDGTLSATIPTTVSSFTNDSGYLTTVTDISGNAGTATTLQTARTINGVNFDGSANITVTAAAGTLTGNTLNSSVIYSSLTSVGTLTNLTVTNPIVGSITGSAGSVAASALTGTTLASNVVSSSLTSVGTLTSLTVSGDVAVNGGDLTTTQSTATLFNTTATTVNIAGGATLATNIGNAAGTVTISGNLQASTNGFTIGYRDIPQLSLTGSATLAATDGGKHYYSTSSSAITLTIPPNSSVAFAIGTAINIVNQGTAAITIAQGSGVTLYLAGNSTSGNRSLASYGVATLQKVATNTWFVVGVGLS